MSEVDWEALAAGFGEVDAEFASDPRSELAKEVGVPLWAWGMFQDMEASIERAREEGETNANEREAAEQFVNNFVSPLERAEARVVWDGDKADVPANLDGRATIELNGWGMFQLVMALKVATQILSQMGPLALMGAGLQPNLEDALNASNIAASLGVSLVTIAHENEETPFEGQEVDASRR